MNQINTEQNKIKQGFIFKRDMDALLKPSLEEIQDMFKETPEMLKQQREFWDSFEKSKQEFEAMDTKEFKFDFDKDIREEKNI